MKQLLRVGNVCNNNCRYCSWRTADKTDAELLDELASFRTDAPLFLSGGEPVIRKNFFPLLARICNGLGFKEVGLVTNGRIFSHRGLAEYAVKRGIGYFFVKLPAFRKSAYRALCGSGGGLEETIAGLENIAKAGPGRLGIIVPVVPENIPELADIAGAVSTLRPGRVLFDLSRISLTPSLKRSLAGMAGAFRSDGIAVGAASPGSAVECPDFLRLRTGGVPGRKRKPFRAPEMDFKISPTTGGYYQTGSDPRSVSPARTIRNAEKVIGKTTFSRIKPLCEGKNGVYIYEFGKSKPESPRSLPAQFGKGFDREQALASGYMETIERFSGVITAAEKRKLIYARYTDIPAAAVAPAAFSITQPAPFYNRKGGRLRESYLPSFMDDAWTWAWSLTKERPALVPAALIYQGFLSRKKRHFLHAKSVGLAAGNTMEEAVIHGINEWLESEALNSLPKPLPFSRLNDIPVLDMGSARCLSPEIKKAGAFVFCFYIRSFGKDVKLHSFLPSVFMDDGDGGYTIISGLACNLDPSNALKRALSELMESCLRRGVDIFSHPGVMRKSGAYRPRTVLPLEQLRNYSTGSIHRDYLEYRKMLDKAGLELIVKDMTKPELGIPAARVLIPGMKLTLLADSLTFTPDSLACFMSRRRKTQ